MDDVKFDRVLKAIKFYVISITLPVIVLTIIAIFIYRELVDILLLMGALAIGMIIPTCVYIFVKPKKKVKEMV